MFLSQSIWIIDPRRKKAFSYGPAGLAEVIGDAFTTDIPRIVLPIRELFD
jgi:hypothetical protein